MTTPEAVFHQPRSVPLLRRIVARMAVAAARLLATQSPRRIRTVLGWLRRGARPASFEQAGRTGHGGGGEPGVAGKCVRSLATILLCRLRAGGRPGAWERGGARPSPPTPGSKPTGLWSARTIRRLPPCIAMADAVQSERCDYTPVRTSVDVRLGFACCRWTIRGDSWFLRTGVSAQPMVAKLAVDTLASAGPCIVWRDLRAEPHRGERC